MARAPRSPRAYALENAAFLRHLRRTGNAHEAARALDLSRSRFTKRRAKDAIFAARWDAALVMAQAALSPKAVVSAARSRRAQAEGGPVLIRGRDGTVQLRRRLPTAIAPADEARFLFALAATANVRLSARAAGFASASFYARKRKNPAFARQWQAALEQGYERVAAALLEASLDDAHANDGWAHNDPPPIPPMTVDQALQLLHLHQKEARALEPPEPLRRRRGESHEAQNVRLTLLHQAWQTRERAKFEAAEAARQARGERPYWGGAWPDDRPDPHEPPRPQLPDLAQVTGWSKADPAKVPHDAGRALFGGWRIGDWKKREEGGGA